MCAGSPPPWLGKGGHSGSADAATPLPDPPPQGGREWRERAYVDNFHQAAFELAASDAKVLSSAARRFNSGAGSSEGSLVSLA